MNPPTPFFWSWSRHRTFEVCHRRYGLDYYLTRAGGRRTASPHKAWLYRLKRTQDGPQWVGLRVHAWLADVLEHARAGRPPEAALAAHHLDEATRHLDAVRGGSPDPATWPDVAELLPPHDADAACHALRAALAARMEEARAHPVLERLLRVPHRVREVERVHRRALDGVRLTASPDVVVDDGRGGLVVIDWKSGDPERALAAAPQLQLYAALIADVYEVDPRRVTALIATTRDGQHTRVTVDADARAAVVNLARRSAEAMRALLPDPARDVAPAHAFPPLPADAAPCATCRYAPACHPR